MPIIQHEEDVEIKMKREEEEERKKKKRETPPYERWENRFPKGV